jgi:hypothetical protein
VSSAKGVHEPDRLATAAIETRGTSQIVVAALNARISIAGSTFRIHISTFGKFEIATERSSRHPQSLRPITRLRFFLADANSGAQPEEGTIDLVGRTGHFREARKHIGRKPDLNLSRASRS